MAAISFIEVLESLLNHMVDWSPDQNEARLTFSEFQNMLLVNDYTSSLRKQRELWHMVISQNLGRDVTPNKRGAMLVMIINVKLVRTFIAGAKLSKR